MKNQPQKCTATKVGGALLFAALLATANAAWAAQVAGVVARLSGPLMVKKADGSVKVLGLRSEIESGDTLVSEKNTYAQIKFIDNSEITLRPGTTFKVENFAYDEGKPEGDSASFNLVKGGLRSVTGLMGKRNKEKFSLKTPSATIGIRGTTFVAQFVPKSDDEAAFAVAAAVVGGARAVDKQPRSGGGSGTVPRDPGAGSMGSSYDEAASQAVADTLRRGQTGVEKQPRPSAGGAPPVSQPRQPAGTGAGAGPTPPGLPPGLHLSVIDGAIVVTNPGGQLGFAAGQFGYVPGPNLPPVVVPNNPGLQFTPPPSFNASTGAGPGNQGPPAPSDAVDCVVR